VWADVKCRNERTLRMAARLCGMNAALLPPPLHRSTQVPDENQNLSALISTRLQPGVENATCKQAVSTAFENRAATVHLVKPLKRFASNRTIPPG